MIADVLSLQPFARSVDNETAERNTIKTLATEVSALN